MVKFTKRDHSTIASVFDDHPESGMGGRFDRELNKRGGEAHADLKTAETTGTKTKSLKMAHSIIQDHPNYHGDFDGDGMGYPHSSHLRSLDKKLGQLKEETMNEDLEELELEDETLEAEAADETETGEEAGRPAEAALKALLDNDVLSFNEIMSDMITSRAADYVNAARDVLAQNAFNTASVEEDDDIEEVEDDFDEEEMAEEFEDLEEEFNPEFEIGDDIVGAINEALKARHGSIGHTPNTEHGRNHIAKIRSIISKHNKENPDNKYRVEPRGRLGKNSPHAAEYKKSDRSQTNVKPEHAKYFDVRIYHDYR